MVEQWLQAFAGLWTSPFYYVALLFIGLQVRKQIRIERQLFAVRLHSWWSECWRIILWGAVAGVLASLLFMFVGTYVSGSMLLMLWGVALFLSFIRIRYFCFAYAGGIVGLLWVIATVLPIPSGAPGVISTLVDMLRGMQPGSMFLLVGVLHLAEALLIHRTAKRLATPLFYESKRGMLVGGYHLQGFWPVPMLLLVPFPDGANGMGLTLPWQPFLAGIGLDGGWTALAFPALIGFQTMTVSRLPGAKASISAKRIACFGIIMAVTGALAVLWPSLWLIAAVSATSFGLHEWITWRDRREEEESSPYFVHDLRGLKVLAVLPGSPAAGLGIQAGYILHKINGQRIRDRAELHAALGQNAAFTKLEVLNHAGESMFLQRALYANEHHQLGLVLCPDDQTLNYASTRKGGWLSFLRERRAGANESTFLS